MLSRDLIGLAKCFEECALRGTTLNPKAIANRLRDYAAQAKELENTVVPKDARGVVDPRDPNVVVFDPQAAKRKA